MISFKQFLSEAEVKPYSFETLSLERVKQLLETSASKAWQDTRSGHKLFRGFQKYHGSGLTDPSTGERKSENVANHYTSLMASNPANEAWPKRSKSFICSTDKWSAEAFGYPHYLIPFNGVKVAYVNEADLHMAASTIRLPGTRDDFHLYYSAIPDVLDIFDIAENATWADLKNAKIAANDWSSDELRKRYRGFALKAGYRMAFKSFLETADDDEIDDLAYMLLHTIEKMLTYDEARDAYGKRIFDLVSNLSSLPDADYECWFSGPCVVLSLEDYALLTGDKGE